MGEHLDLWSSYSNKKNNLDVFNMNLVNAIAINKSAYYSFKLPIFAPLLLVKNGKKKATEELSNICIEFGRLMQCQVTITYLSIISYDFHYFGTCQLSNEHYNPTVLCVIIRLYVR